MYTQEEIENLIAISVKKCRLIKKMQYDKAIFKCNYV